MKKAMGFIALTLSFGATALTGGSVQVNVDGVPFQVSTTLLTPYKDAMAVSALAVKNCAPADVTMRHPLNNRDSQIVVAQKGRLCEVVWLRDMKWRYTCLLTQADKNDFSEEMTGWINKQSALGDFPTGLTHFLFNPSACSSKQI